MGAAPNPWRGEVDLAFGEVKTVLRCRIEHFAMLAAALEVKTLVEVHDQWQKLDPSALKESLRILAESPAEGDRLWNACPGSEGMLTLMNKFFIVTSGKTPEDIAKESEARKKLESWIAGQSEPVIQALVDRLQEIKELPA